MNIFFFHAGYFPGDFKKPLSFPARNRLCHKNHEPIIIFPEGTRCKHGQVKGYKSGIVFLADGLDMPIVPVALNTDLHWSKSSFIRRPGTVTFEFMEPMRVSDYASKKEFMAELENRIETACAKLG